MCGFAGFLDCESTTAAPDWERVLRGMGDRLYHRGPDEGGHWLDRDAGIGLAHRRLAILDLSPAGHQPMTSASGRYVIAFNGEIYNHLMLRAGLGERAWRGHSDTETLLAAFEAWGIERTLKASVGMFAFALWDRTERRLTLARDRLGEKPLYYGWQGRVFLFGSELKALRAHPAFIGDVDRDAVTQLLRHNAIGAPHSIYRGIRKLPSGTWLQIRDRARSEDEPRPTTYWSLAEVARRGLAEPFGGSPEEAVDLLETRLSEAIALQKVADVPLGAFLSGGIDSSTVVALMQSQADRPVRTFSIGFREQGYDEAEYAAAVARHLGTEHTELYVTPDEAMAVIPDLPKIWDEPFADSSQIPTYLVSQLARRNVTVSLSGDGGDELFGGYDRYFVTLGIWRKLGWLPARARRVGASALTCLQPAQWDRLLRPLPPAVRRKMTGDRLHKLAEMLSARNGPDFYRQMISLWKDPAAVVLGGGEPPSEVPEIGSDLFAYMMLHDGLHYLPTDILAKVDRAAMAVSLETRVPLLDHRVVELAWQLPPAIRTRDGRGKWPLRQVLYRHVPRRLIERPKMGFGVPIGDWLRGPLRGWAEGLLSEPRLRGEGFFDPVPIRRMWVEHQRGERQWHYYLWTVLMFQAWWELERTDDGRS